MIPKSPSHTYKPSRLGLCRMVWQQQNPGRNVSAVRTVWGLCMAAADGPGRELWGGRLQEGSMLGVQCGLQMWCTPTFNTTARHLCAQLNAYTYKVIVFPNTAGCSGSVASGSIGWDYTWVWQNFYQELGAYTHGGPLVLMRLVRCQAWHLVVLSSARTSSNIKSTPIMCLRRAGPQPAPDARQHRDHWQRVLVRAYAMRLSALLRPLAAQPSLPPPTPLSTLRARPLHAKPAHCPHSHLPPPVQ
jgi:hypothetical protein